MKIKKWEIRRQLAERKPGIAEGMMYHTGSPLVLYNTECKSGGVQKLSGAVFCTRGTAEKLTIL